VFLSRAIYFRFFAAFFRARRFATAFDFWRALLCLFLRNLKGVIDQDVLFIPTCRIVSPSMAVYL
jgi:hypothetical protein